MKVRVRARIKVKVRVGVGVRAGVGLLGHAEALCLARLQQHVRHPCQLESLFIPDGGNAWGKGSAQGSSAASHTLRVGPKLGSGLRRDRARSGDPAAPSAER